MPPNAYRRFSDELRPKPAGIPPEAIQIDVGRAVGGGDFVRVWLMDEQFADRLPESSPPAP